MRHALCHHRHDASITANTPLNVLVKLIAIFMFVIAYKLGRKITDIKV